MAGRSYDLRDDVSITSFADVEERLNEIVRYVKEVVGGEVQIDGTIKSWLDGIDGDYYWKITPSEKKVQLMIEEESSGTFDRA